MNQQHHPDIEELLGAYALNAIDADERRLVERYLWNCPECEAEVSDHREAATLLVRRICSGRCLGSHRLRPRGRSTASRTGAGDFPRPSPGPRQVGAGRSDGGGRGVRLVHQERRLDQMQTAMAQDAVQRAIVVALANPTAKTVELRATDSSAAARVALLPDGRGYLVADGLTDLAPDRTYQSWALVDGERISAGTLGPQPKFAAFNVSGRVAAFSITEEKAPGVAFSRNPPVLIGWSAPPDRSPSSAVDERQPRPPGRSIIRQDSPSRTYYNAHDVRK